MSSVLLIYVVLDVPEYLGVAGALVVLAAYFIAVVLPPLKPIPAEDSLAERRRRSRAERLSN